MRRLPASISILASSSRRLRLALVITALTVPALGACGTEKVNADGEQTKPAGAVRGQPDAAFAAMLDKIAQSCPPSAPPVAPPSGPAKTLPTDFMGTAPPSDAIEPIAPTAGPEVELNARDWCASALHEERTAQALWELTDPTPTEVRTILNDLGYVDDRIHGLKRSGATTRFFLDLRDKNGQLCLEGSAAGEKTVVDACVASATGPFTPGDR